MINIVNVIVITYRPMYQKIIMENNLEFINPGKINLMNEGPLSSSIDWTPEQDSMLKILVAIHGPHNWVAISNRMNEKFGAKKLGKEYRERWCNRLDPAINHAPWTEEEEAVLILAHMKIKNRWCDIVELLKGRHNNMIKNRFYSIFRKVKNKVKNSDLTYSSEIELIEIHYMISVMEDYLRKPPPPVEPKRKRGRDFLYNLIDDIEFQTLISYKKELHRLYPVTVPLDQALTKVLHSHTKTTQSFDLDEYVQKVNNIDEAQKGSITLPVPKSINSIETLNPEEKELARKVLFMGFNCEFTLSKQLAKKFSTYQNSIDIDLMACLCSSSLVNSKHITEWSSGESAGGIIENKVYKHSSILE